MVVLVNVYTGTLTSMLTKPSFKFLANSIDDVADNEHIKPYVTIKSSLEEYIRVSKIIYSLKRLFIRVFSRILLSTLIKRFDFV